MHEDRSPPSLLRWLPVFVAVVVFIQAVAASAGDGGVVRLPKLGVKPKSGLQVTVDTRWTGGYGYRPVRVTANIWPPGKAPADRTLLIELTPLKPYEQESATTASQFIEIPQGQTSATTIVLVPQEYIWEDLSCSVYEDGRRLSDVSTNGMANARFVTHWEIAGLSVLVVDSNAPTLADRAARKITNLRGRRLLPDLRNVIRYPEMQSVVMRATGDSKAMPIDDRDLLDLIEQSNTTEMLPPDDLPQQWLAYSGIDLVFISVDELRQLKASHHRRWQALRDWLVTGPTLCVTGAGDNFAKLPEIEKLLDAPPVQAQDNSQESLAGGWQRPTEEMLAREIHAFQDYSDEAAADGADFLVDGEAMQKPSITPLATGIAMREMGLGTVVAFSAENPFSENAEYWRAVFSAVGQSRWHWAARHGLSPRSGQPYFWNQLIPGLDMAPVDAFRILISLFVIVIGPLNFVVLRRLRRPYLVLATAPLAAAAITVMLFGYALVRDGFGTQTRVRSFTLLDQRQQTAVSWSRQTYFAGFAPAEGMRFPKDVAVYPIEAAGFDAGRGAHRELDWRDRGQRLTSGYLPTRQTVQFLTVGSSRDVGRRLDFAASKSDATALSVTNRLGTPVRHLLVADEKGNLCWTKDLAVGETASPVGVSASQAVHLSEIYNTSRLRFPSGLQSSGRGMLTRGNYRYYSGIGEAMDDSASVLEVNLTRAMVGDRLAPRSYFAVVDSSPAVPLGIEGAAQRESFHVILGRW